MIDCCKIGCWARAEFAIYTQRIGGGSAGPDPYGDETYACEQHVGELLGHQPQAIKPEEICWQVLPVEVTSVV